MTAFGVKPSKVSPHFLHSNSTSHTWPFSAIAELIDNAYDPDVAATELHINRVCEINGQPCLLFEDNGNGMDQEHLWKMLSFGFCEKDSYVGTAKYLPIGHYGNGFKSGSMRLANDALVLTVSRQSAGIGFLSQTYLEAIKADTVLVPILEYRFPEMERVHTRESNNNLDSILKHSPFQTEKELKAELQEIRRSRSGTGTKIILFNLKRSKDGRLELDFKSDRYDIRNPEAHEVDLTSVSARTTCLQTAEYIRSLQAYCSILFLRPRMKIFIRGVKVKSKLISKSLSQTEIDTYKPTWMETPLRITFGFASKMVYNQEEYGVMFYHRNRLIKAYEKLGYQKQANELGVGVVGVVEVDFLNPIHNKQNFEQDGKYNAVMSAIATKLNDYWNEKKNGAQNGNLGENRSNLPDWLWAQCDGCLKWRRLPANVRGIDLPDKWYCHMNPDPTHSRCEIAQEPEDEDLAVQRPTYEKTFKKKMKMKRNQKLADIDAKEAELKAREADLLERQRKQRLSEDMQLVTNALTSVKRQLSVTFNRDSRGKRMLSEVGDSGSKRMKQTMEDMTVERNDGAKTEEKRGVSCVSPTHLQLQSLALTEQVISQHLSHGASPTPITVTSTRTTSAATPKKHSAPSVSASPLRSSSTLIEAQAKQSGRLPVSSPTSAFCGNGGKATTFFPLLCISPPPRTDVGADNDVIDLVDEKAEGSLCLSDTAQLEDIKLDTREVSLAMAALEKKTTNKSKTKILRQETNHAMEAGAAEVEASKTVTVTTQNQHVQVNLAEEEKSVCKDITHKYEKLEQRFKEIQKNVHTVFHFLVPDVDLGEEGNIEAVLRTMTGLIHVQEKKE